MTPQERQMLDQLFDRLATLENTPRDPEAMRAISEGLARAPGAIYPLVQSVLVQDEALKRADARIRELENELGIDQGQPAQQQTGFLDNMRDALFGKPHGSVPSVPSSRPSVWGQGGAGAAPQQPQGYAQPGYGQPQPGFGGGGSFLGTAAASAAGVIGGALLMNSFRGMFGGGHQGQAFGGDMDRGTPWGPSASGSDLAREAGIDDVGGQRTAAYDDSNDGQRAGLFDVAENDVDDDGDLGGGFDSDGGSDTA